MSFKPEVIADNTGKWVGNALRFATEEEAKIYVDDLMMRWTAVRDTRVVECDDPVTDRIEGNGPGTMRRLVKVLSAALIALLVIGSTADARGSGGSRLGRGHSHVSTSVHTHSR